MYKMSCKILLYSKLDTRKRQKLKFTSVFILHGQINKSSFYFFFLRHIIHNHPKNQESIINQISSKDMLLIGSTYKYYKSDADVVLKTLARIPEMWIGGIMLY